MCPEFHPSVTTSHLEINISALSPRHNKISDMHNLTYIQKYTLGLSKILIVRLTVIRVLRPFRRLGFETYESTEG